jgi:hypothetical protein
MPVHARREGDTLFVDNVDLKRAARNFLKKASSPDWRAPADINQAMEFVAAMLGYPNLNAVNEQAATPTVTATPAAPASGAHVEVAQTARRLIDITKTLGSVQVASGYRSPDSPREERLIFKTSGVDRTPRVDRPGSPHAAAQEPTLKNHRGEALSMVPPTLGKFAPLTDGPVAVRITYESDESRYETELLGSGLLRYEAVLADGLPLRSVELAIIMRVSFDEHQVLDRRLLKPAEWQRFCESVDGAVFHRECTTSGLLDIGRAAEAAQKKSPAAPAPAPQPRRPRP